ncbi:hypothetical protein ROHU_025871 [Labeo rohita]|uniref:Uncharacterized protein n=1 Tax=Labeo rohita TaxID=84645 RepID=A0A498MQD2_LABRO|nr:hypothetical protein ROHU_025871 [Labeo rohita]
MPVSLDRDIETVRRARAGSNPFSFFHATSALVANLHFKNLSPGSQGDSGEPVLAVIFDLLRDETGGSASERLSVTAGENGNAGEKESERTLERNGKRAMKIRAEGVRIRFRL